MSALRTLPSPHGFFKWLFALTLLLSSFFFFEAAKRPLASPDEGRYSEIPREMVVSGDYLTPRLNTVKYFEKPPLFYWMQAASLKIFGVTDGAARCMNILVALLGCLVTFWAGWFLFSPRTGVLSSLILASSLLYYGISRIVILDMAVSVFLTGALFSMLYALTKNSKAALYGSYIFCALGTLTKGVIGFGIPGAVILLWLILSRQWVLMGRALSLKGILIFLLIVAPWHILVSLKNPEFAWFYFIHEHVLRLTTQVHQRYQPLWFFIPIFVGGLFPWIAFFVQSVRETCKEKLTSLPMALVLWTGFVLILFSLSQSKLIPYILPCMPPAAVLMGRLFDQAWELDENPKLRKTFAWNLLWALPLAIGVYVAPLPAYALPFMGPQTRLWISLVILTTGAVPFLLRSNLPRAFMALLITAMTLLLSLNHISPILQRPSTRELAIQLKPLLTPRTPVICFEFYPQELPYYLERPVMISGWEGELQFGLKVEDKTNLIFSHLQTKKLWDQTDQIFILVRDDTLKNLDNLLKTPFHIVYKHHTLNLISKRPVTFAQ